MVEAPGRVAVGPEGPGPSGPPGGHGDQVRAPHPAGGVDERVKRQLWVITCCLALALLAFVDRPGKIIADTKLDMAINPLGFLARAAHLWDPAQFGQLQNQAVGYFFPMGPFFIAGKFLALPPWVVQRLWMTAIAVTAFLGIARLTARLGIGNPASRMIAAMVYALAPRELSQLGVISIELLPAAVAPWIMIPLVRAVHEAREGRRGGRIRAAAQSAAAVAFCGGVNAVSVLSALLPALIYLVTLPRPAPRWRILGWWLPLVGAVTMYWAYSLLLLARYGTPFLPYTESAAVTTSVTGLSDALRGTEDWVTYLIVNGHAWWPLGFWISGSVFATIITGLLAGLGLTGLLTNRLPLRRTWLCILLIGLLIIGTGYLSGLGNPLALPLQHLINGPLAPLRNLRKFDPLIRMPLAVGLAHLLATVRLPAARKVVAGATVTAMGLVALPAFTGGLSAAGDFVSIPQYWQSTASWLNRHAGNQAVLEVPGARFGEYLWGRPMDDVLQPLFYGDWASRQLDSLGSPGLTRLLDAIDLRLAAGEGSAGLADLLGRMGVRFVVVRNDLIRSDLRGAWPGRIHQALSQSPGIVKVAQFGALPVGNLYPDDAVGNLDTLYPPVEVYRVTGAQPEAGLFPVAATIRVYGGPEALLTMADERLLRDRPVLLNSDATAVHAGQAVVTDSLRRRTVNFGEIRVNYSPTLAATDPARTFEATDDYVEPGWRRFASTARYYGIANVTSSSSVADIGAIPVQSATGRLPFAAVDGDLRTMWESGSLAGPIGQWIKIRFTRLVGPGTIRVAFADNRAIGPPVTRVTVATASGQVTDRVRPKSGFQSLAVPPGSSIWLRITITKTLWKASPAIGRQAGISEIDVPGVSASRAIIAPTVSLRGGVSPNAFVLAKAEPQPSDCMPTSARWVCTPQLMRPTEEQYGFDRVFTATRSRPFRMTGTVFLTDVKLAERYAWLGRYQPRVKGSSSYTEDPQTQPQSAFDGNSQTTWVAGRADRQPTLTIRWAHARVIRSVTIARPPGASGPLQLLMLGAHGQARGADIWWPVSKIKFVPMRTARITFIFTPSALPLQVTDVTIPGVKSLFAVGTAPFRLPCGYGPAIELNGQLIPTRVSGVIADLLNGAPMAFAACKLAHVAAGANVIVEPSQDSFDVQGVVLDRTGGAAITSSPAFGRDPLRVLSWGPALRVLRITTTAPSYLVVNENFNAGWVARLGDQILQPVRLDGWKQGWLLPPVGSSLVTLSYAPDASFRLSLVAGLAAVAMVFIVATWPRRRRRWAVAGAVAVDGRPGTPGQTSWRRSGWARGIRRCWMLTRAAAGVGAIVGAGYWLGGTLGAVVTLVTCGFFVTMLSLSRRYRLARLVCHPWLVLLLLTAASMSQAAGVHLRNEGLGTVAVTDLWNAGPQLLCLLIVGRLLAAIVMGEPRSRMPARSPWPDEPV